MPNSEEVRLASERRTIAMGVSVSRLTARSPNTEAKRMRNSVSAPLRTSSKKPMCSRTGARRNMIEVERTLCMEREERHTVRSSKARTALEIERMISGSSRIGRDWRSSQAGCAQSSESRPVTIRPEHWASAWLRAT